MPCRSCFGTVGGFTWLRWCDFVGTAAWLYNNASRPATATLVMSSAIAGFVDRWARFGDDECRIIQQLGEVDHSPLVANGLPEVFSLIHVDCQLDNLLFHPGRQTELPLNWQSIAQAPA